MENFRGSDRFPQWRGRIGPYFAAPPRGRAFHRRGGGVTAGSGRAVIGLRDHHSARRGRRRHRRQPRPGRLGPARPRDRGGPRLHRVVAPPGGAPGRRPAVGPAPGWSASTSAATAGRAGQHRRRPGGTRPRGGGRVGPGARVRPGGHVGFSMGASVVVRHAGLHGGRGARWWRSAARAAGTTAGPRPCAACTGSSSARSAGWSAGSRCGPASRRPAGIRCRPRRTSWPPGSPRRRCWSCTATPTTTSRSSTPSSCSPPPREPKELWIEPGFGHAENAAPDELLRRIGGWLASAARPR